MQRVGMRHLGMRHLGMTMAEVLIALTIMTMIVGAVGALAQAVQTGWQRTQGQNSVTQQARVALQRISQRIRSAYSSPNHPGVMVVYDVVGSEKYPDTLVVWSPSGTPANPNGPPLISECVFYSPDPSSPNRLLEITAPADTRQIPLDDTLNSSSWRSTLATLKTASTTNRVLLADLLRVASTTSSSNVLPTNLAVQQASVTDGGVKLTGSVSSVRGVVRFWREVTPSVSAWTSYKAGTTSWSNLDWPQGVGGDQFGMRQVWVRFEMQLVPGTDQLTSASSSQTAVPFFGSAALYPLLPR